MLVQVTQLGSTPYPLFNATVRFNQTELCPTNDIISFSSTEISSSPSEEPPTSVTTVPLSLLGHTTCEVVEAVSRSRSDTCHVDPNSCQSMECSLHQIRIKITFLSCDETPGVNIDAYHMLEEVTLLHEDFTTSQRKPVDFRGETILFHLNVTLERSPSVPNQITFKVGS